MKKNIETETRRWAGLGVEGWMGGEGGKQKERRKSKSTPLDVLLYENKKLRDLSWLDQ